MKRRATCLPVTANSRAACVLGFLLCGASACSAEDDRPPPLQDFGDAEPIAGCERFSYEPCDITSAACQEEIFGLVRCVAGEPPAPAVLPPVSLLSREEAYVRLLGSDAADMPTNAAFTASLRALEGLGLLEPGLASDEQTFVAASLDGVLAVYLDDSKEIIVLDDGAPADDEDANMILAHELVHAIQDQKHDLPSLQAQAPQTFDGSLALAGLIEGEATVYQTLLAFAYNGLSSGDADFTSLQSFADQLSIQLGSPALLARNLFPYTYGATFAGAIWRRGGARALDATYGSPPADTLAIVSQEGATRSSIPQLAAPLAGYSLLEEDAFGAWVVAATAAASLLPAPGDFDVARLARAWRGDHYAAYQKDDGATLVVEWMVRWEDADAAGRFASYYEDWSPPWGRLRVRAAGDTAHVVLANGIADADAWLDR
jgi:hypothetical protein